MNSHLLARSCLACLALAATSCADVGQPPVTAPSRPPEALAGSVVESGTGTPVAAARVCIRQSTNGDEHGANCAETLPDGSYRVTFSGPLVGNCPWVYHPGFEGRQDCVALTSPVMTWNPAVQRVIRIQAGQSIASTIFANEKVSGSEDYCTPCKLVRIVAVRAGRLTVRITPETGLRLDFWYHEQRLNEPYPVPAGQELPVTVMSSGGVAPRSFELSTEFEPG
jgi:hypothetical protein